MCLRATVAVMVLVVIAGCSNPLGPKYEYEEQMYLYVDGSAQVIVDASMPALVALRKLPVDLAARASIDREQVRAWFAEAGCQDVRVGQPWVRSGRRFVQVRVSVDDVRNLSRCAPLAWSTYSFEREGDSIHYLQIVGPSAVGNPGTVNWNGTEIVAFRLHAPSRIAFHDVRRLKDGEAGEADRGNILTWEQRLSDRLAGRPVHMEVRMGADSILYRTLWLFGGAFVAAVVTMISVIWLTVRRAKKRVAARA